MTDIYKLTDFYISLKRIFYNKPITKPKPETKDYNNLIRLGVLLDENGINYEDYILVNIQAYRKRKVFPRVDQLLGLKALNRYNDYARRKYKVGKTFRADTHSVCVYSTNIYYPIEEFHKPMDQDLKILMIWSFVKEGKVVFEKEKSTKIWEVLEYLIAKYELNGLEVPDSIFKWKAQLEKDLTCSRTSIGG